MRLPSTFIDRTSVAGGGLLSYGVGYYPASRRAAKYVHRVLLGTSPADLPVEQLEKIELVINLKTAKALRLTVPQSVLVRADEVIRE